MTRIAYVLTQARGGPVDVTFTLLRALLDVGGHDVRVFGPVPDGHDELLGDHFTHVEVGRKEDLAAIRRLRCVVRAWRPDVVHAQDRRAALVTSTLQRHARTVWTYHGVPYDVRDPWCRGDDDAQAPSWYSRAVLGGDAVVARRTDRVVVPSSVMQDFLHSRLRIPLSKMHHIDNGIELPDATPLKGPIRRLAYIGNLYPAKGLSDLFAALSKPGVLPADATLDVYGDGPSRAEAEALAQQPPLRGHIRFHGFTPGAARLLPQHDALVLSSRLEQQPLVIAQAMGAGRPVLATSVGGVPEMLDIPGTATYLVRPGDIDGLADQLVRLFAETNLTELSTKLAAYARDRFSARGCAAAHLKLYDALAGGLI
jgi:glycosyltransferase involved in cell wall biosynthesis